MNEVRIVPANRASWEDLQAVFSSNGESQDCSCQWFKVSAAEWKSTPRAVRMANLREQTACGHDDAEETTGLIAYVGGEPAGWVAVEPRTRYRRLLRARTPWLGREENKADDGVWVVSCLVIRPVFRGMHLSYALAEAAVPHARAAGAHAVEAYPMVTEPGKEMIWNELYVGPLGAFEAAGFAVVSAPSKRRRVVRVEFETAGS